MLSWYWNREWQLLWQTPLRALVVFFYLGLSGWAVYSGYTWQSNTVQFLSQTPANMLTDRGEWLDQLAQVETGDDTSPYSARPMNYTIQAIHKPEPLAALAYRNESIHPRSTLVNGWRSEVSLFQRYEVEGPSLLYAGKLDLKFVIVVLLPLVLLVLSFDVISREKSAGRFSLFLVQGGDPAKLVLARVSVVALPLLLISTLGIMVPAFLFEASLANWLLWQVAMMGYLALWMAIASWLAVAFPRPTTGTFAVLAVWSTMVVLLPSGSQFLAQSIYPIPSRVSYLSESRSAEAETRLNVTQRAEVYMAQHPGQGSAPDQAVPGFYRSAYLANVDINEHTSGIVTEFEQQQTNQRNFVGLLQFVSPAILLENTFNAASATGATRAAEFRSEARNYLNMLLDKIGPATVNRSRLSLAEASTIPEFAMQPPALGLSDWFGVIWLGLLSGCIGWVVANKVKGLT